MKEQRKYVSYDTRFLSTGLDIQNMILLTEIENLSKLEKGCYATDVQLGELILVGRQNTNERIKLLEKLGYIKTKVKYIIGKKNRIIEFTFNKPQSSQDDSGRRSHKLKPQSSQDDSGQKPQSSQDDSGQKPQSSQDDNNKLYKHPRLLEPGFKKEINKETSEYTGPELEDPEVDDFSLSGITRPSFYNNSNEIQPEAEFLDSINIIDVFADVIEEIPISSNNDAFVVSKEDKEQLRRKLMKLNSLKQDLLDLDCMETYKRKFDDCPEEQFIDKVLDLPISDYDWRIVEPRLIQIRECRDQIADFVDKIIPITAGY